MSRLKSGLGARGSKGKKAAAPSRPAGRQVMVAKPKSDVYVALLGVSLGAILIGMLLLALVLRRYDFQTQAAWNTPAPTATAMA